MSELIEYKDGYRTLRINPEIKTKVMLLDIKHERLNQQYIKERNKKNKLEKKLDEDKQEQLKPFWDRMDVLNKKMQDISEEKRITIESHCTHKTRTRWTGGDYNERLVRECINCDKDFGEVQ